MTDLDFIKRFSKISITELCKKHSIDKSNLWAGRGKKEYATIIRNELIMEFIKILNDYINDER